MVEKDLYRKFVGNVCLYRQLAVREPPTFLRRNLDQALDAHERLLRQDTTTSANRRPFTCWDYSDADMLQDMLKGRRPVLRIDALQLRLLDSEDNGTWKTPRPRSEDKTVPAWLPSHDEEFRVPCRVVVNVVDARSPKRVLYTRPELATTVGRKDNKGELYYDIELEGQYFIELDKLFVASEAGYNGVRRWKRTVTLDYILELSIQCQDSDDTAELFSRLESRDVSNYPAVPADEGAIKAIWRDLPACPETGTLLSLKRTKGHKSVEMKYGLDVSMGWSKRTETPLVALNRLRNNDGSHQLPTPSVSDDLEVTQKQVKVHYEFNEGMQTRIHSLDTLRCVFCEGDREYGSASRLLLHYKISHEHFAFESSSRRDPGGKQQVSITITLAEGPSVHQAAIDPKNPVRQEWIAPDKPFDISAHVGGDENWIGGNRAKAPVKRGRPRKNRNSDNDRVIGNSGYAHSTQAQIQHPLRDRVNLAEVRDLPEIVHVQHAVPVVAGVEFYHTHSKQPIKSGETVWDDEDGGADFRLTQSQYRNIREHGLSNVKVEFHHAFNQHLDTEQSASKELLRDGLVRFERRYHRELQGDWRKPFKEKLEHLLAHKVIARDVLDYCLQTKPSNDGGSHGLPNGQGVDKGDAQNTDDSRQVDGDIEMMDAPNQSAALASEAGSPALPRKNGKYTKRMEMASMGNESNQTTPSKAKKPHRWSGGGADRDVIRSGLILLDPTGSSTQESDGDVSMRDTSRPATKTPMLASSASAGKKPSRIRYEGGDFHRFGDTETPDLDTHSARPKGAPRLAIAIDAKEKQPVVKGRCMCGLPVHGGMGAVMCDDLDCARRDFHLACVGLGRPTLGWKCGECSSA